jgi:LysM repeat protein
MRRNYKLIVSIIALSILSLGAFAQSEAEYKDVVLDGEPAKLNVTTGEIILVNLTDKKKVEPIKTIEEYVTEEASIKNTLDFYVVKEGETLLEIANRYHTSLTELKRANNLETTLVNTGQYLRVRNLDSASNTATQATAYTKTSNFHTVENGQTLYSLAKRYNLTLNELKTLNNLKSNLITVGQKLRVKDFSSTNVRDHVSLWIVSKGDTLYSIASENGITVDTIKDLNGLTGNRIHIGQKLKLK